MYIRTRMAIDEVVAQANDELSAGSADVPRVEPAVVAGGSDAETVAPHTGAEPTAASEGTRVSWVTAGGIERHEAGELGDLLQREDGFVWVDIPSLDAEAERLLTDVFRFHPFAIRECREPGKVPKMHAYADHLFAVLHAPEPRPTGEVDHRELNQFIGLRYLVTVHERPESMSLGDDVLETNTVFGRIAAGRAHPRSPSELSYAIVTRLAARMEALVSELATSAAALDRRVIQSRSGAPEAIVDEMFELRHALLAVETMADQNRTVWARTSALTALHVPPEHRPLIEDLRDQFGRVRRLCQGQRELLQGALDFARTRSTAKMDRAMSRLALLSAVALPISIISSIYGMNLFVFNRTHIELLGLTLGAMALLTLVMLRWARQQGWQ
jgi:Mg2+ and Co2+ transporter CorA